MDPSPGVVLFVADLFHPVGGLAWMNSDLKN